MNIKKIQEMKNLNGVDGSFRYKAIEKQYYKELELNFKGENNIKLVQKLHCMWQLLQKRNAIINIYEDGVKVAGDSIEEKRAFVLWEDLEVLVNRKCKLINNDIVEMEHDITLENHYLEELYLSVNNFNTENNATLIKGLHCVWQLSRSGFGVLKNSHGIDISNKPLIVGEKNEKGIFIKWGNLEEEIIKRHYLLLN